MRSPLPDQQASSTIRANKEESYWCYKKKLVAALLLFLCITVSIPITVMITAPATNNVIVPPPGNDQCIHATKLKVNGPVIKGTFRGATLSDDGGAFCGAAEAVAAQSNDDDDDHHDRVDVWYKFRGTGDTVRVILKLSDDNNNNINDDDVSVAMYYGVDCNTLLGVKTNVTFGGNNASSTGADLDWIECNSPNAPIRTVKNEMYYIYAAANTCHFDDSCDDMNNNKKNGEEFTIAVETVTTSPINNRCETALALLPITDNGIITNTTVNGTLQDTLWSSVLSKEDYFGSGSFGVWYVVHGNDERLLKLTLQDNIDNVRLRLQLFTGPSCESLTLIKSEQQYIPPISNETLLAALGVCSLEQECVFMMTEAGETYWVYGYTKDAYMYTLPQQQDDERKNDLSFEISAQFL